MAENNEIVLASGAKLLITMAPFDDADDLQKAVIHAFLSVGGKEMDLKNSEMISVILSCAASKEVTKALFKCGERVIYMPDGKEESKHPFSKALFDLPGVGEKAREDYYPILSEIGKVNLKPFWTALCSALKTMSDRKTVSQEQK
jgi:hypothetical protein